MCKSDAISILLHILRSCSPAGIIFRTMSFTIVFYGPENNILFSGLREKTVKYRKYDPENNVLFSGSNKKPVKYQKYACRERERETEFLEDLKNKI